MMTCQTVCEGALRKLGKLGSGRSARPSDLQNTVEALKGLYAFLINSGAFGRLRDVIPQAYYIAGENERVFRNSEAVDSVTLPELVPVCDPWWGDWEYGAQWVPPGNPTDRNSRPPRDCAVVVVTDAVLNQTSTYIYDGQGKQWLRLDNLALSDGAPLSDRDPGGLQSLLAMHMGDEFGTEISSITMARAGMFQESLLTRFSTQARTVFQPEVYC